MGKNFSTYLSIAILFSFYSVIACDSGSNGVNSPGDALSTINVTYPHNGIIWTTGLTNTEVHWESAQGDSVRIEIWKDTSKVADYCFWTENDGAFTRTTAVLGNWGEGNNFKIKVIDSLGNIGWSDFFALSSVALPAGMTFVSIPKGSFMMGTPSDELGSRPAERPVHTVSIEYSFEMMTTEVTQEMWLEVMGSNPSEFTGLDHPVEMVSQLDAEDFISAMGSFDPSYKYRLPTEAEWEYCCRAGTSSRFYWGNDPEETAIDNYAWWWKNSNNTTHPVAEKQPNAWGLYDMCGNVREWCEDTHHEDYSNAPSNGSAWINDSFSYRVVIRGGDCDEMSPKNLRSAMRQFVDEFSRSRYQGFRLVRYLPAD